MDAVARVTGNRWDFCAEGYDQIIQREFADEQAKKWGNLLRENAPCKTGRVLDVGTGPGYFSVLMGLMGWKATGIDCSQKMVETAGRNAERAGIKASYFRMDNHALEFADNTFDYLISRNVTWILYRPEQAFREWLRVLKPGGRLLYLDANWHYSRDLTLTQACARDRGEYIRLYGEPENTYHGDEKTDAEFRKTLYFNNVWRPDWDKDHLPKFGYCNIRVTERVNEYVYDVPKQLLYRSMPMFLVTADKPLRDKK